MTAIFVIAALLAAPQEPTFTPNEQDSLAKITCGHAAIEAQTRGKQSRARPLVETRRWKELHALCLPVEYEGWGNDELVIYFVDSAVVLGRTTEAIHEATRVHVSDGLNLRTSCLPRYIRALKFWAEEDLDGILNLVAEEKHMRGWSRLHPEDPRNVTYLRAIVDLAGDLGDDIIEPLMAEARRDPRNAAVPMHALAALRSGRSREIVNSWPEPLRSELLRTQEQPKRLLPFDRSHVFRTRQVKALEEARRILGDTGYAPPATLPGHLRLIAVIFVLLLGMLAVARLLRNRIADRAVSG